MALRADRGIRGVDNLGIGEVLGRVSLDVPLRGNRAPFGDQESVGSDCQRGVVMKATPASPFIMSKPEFLLQFLIVALDPPAQLCHMDDSRSGISAGRVASQYLVGSASPEGHSIKHHSSGLGVVRL
jgi:hypothetical protein